MSKDAQTFDLATCPIEPGVTLVEASAGTGKTYSLAGLVLRLLLEGHVTGIGKILVMTFTNAATAELVDRIRALVRQAVVAFERGGADDAFLAELVGRHGSAGFRTMRVALRDLDDIEVSTIHGFCARVLEQNALEAGVPFDMELVENENALLRRAAEAFWRETVYPMGAVAAQVLADKKIEPATWLKAYRRSRSHPQIRIAPEPLSLEAALAALDDAGAKNAPEVDAFEHALRARFIRDLEPLVEREKRIGSTAGFDDLLRRLHTRLGDAPANVALRRAIAAQFETVLVDEFQDTDEIQLEIFEALFAEMKLFYVGDPKQAIYAFRGADVFAYLRAKRGAPRVYTMGKNWRSEAPLIAAVNLLHGRIPSPFVIDEIPFVRVEAAEAADKEALTGDGRAPFEWLYIPTQKSKTDGRTAACNAVARECVRLLDSANGARIGTAPVEPRNIAVLVRKNFEAKQLRDVLARAGVPAVVSQAGSVFASDEACELDILLRAVLDPHRSSIVRAALSTRCFGRDAAGIAELAEDEARWQALGEQLDEVRTLWHARGFAAMASRLLDVADARSHLLALDDGERRLTNLLHLVELGQQAIVELGLSPDALAAWLAQRIAETENGEEDVAELRLESDDDAVQIVTIHKSKGLEYDVVFVPFAWDAGSGPDKDGRLVHLGGETVLYFGKLDDDTKAAADAEATSEDARLAYVAITRAKHRCYVAWGAVGSDASASAALARLIDPDLSAWLAKSGKQSRDRRREAVDKRFRAALEKLCHESSGTMALRDYDPTPPPRWRRPGTLLAELSVREFPPTAAPQLEPWRLASFSSLVGGVRATTRAARTVAEQPDYVDPEAEPTVSESAARGMFAFARGAQAGTCLHEIFEKIDFTHAFGDELEAAVGDALARHGLEDRAAHRGEIDPPRDVASMIRDVLATALPGERFTLATVSRAQKLSEWQFYLPMAAVSAARFADVLARHGAKLTTPAYVNALRGLGDRRVEGFLTGFVDLVFEHEGRFYVVDWKSNHLGNAERDYGDAAIAHSMREHHYVLQYHLYVLALHRYLRQRVPEYDYERHVGGVCYAYVRGIRPGKDKTSATGWYHDRPARELVEALDALVGGTRA